MPQKSNDETQLLSSRTIADLLEVRRQTLRRWWQRGYFPAPDKRLPSGRLRWKRSTVTKWLEEVQA